MRGRRPGSRRADYGHYRYRGRFLLGRRHQRGPALLRRARIRRARRTACAVRRLTECLHADRSDWGNQKAKKIIITAVNGLCRGGGFMTAMTSDICVASENASFCVPEARLGLIDAWVAYRLPLYVGMARAKNIILTCRPFDAASAAKWGLISDVVPRADLEAYVAELAADICAAGPAVAPSLQGAGEPASARRRGNGASLSRR